ncbi:hypothetical protein [Acinetobacter pseudolwoffii]|uniref:hypothetical protein n=1 Tax=Acinetobacter pseudolwoffii TaxID=2053287 RepID=UPI0021E4DC30|nr:hypothetical protein [Acinetobacter pseudolwoffii]
MDIQEEKEAYLGELLEREVITQDEFRDLVFKPEVNAFDSNYLSSRFIDKINFGWSVWQAKAQAVPEKTVKLHLVWNENKDECVGFLDSKDSRYTATGDDRGMFGVTALGDYFRDLNDERNEFETQIVMIEAQEPAND